MKRIILGVLTLLTVGLASSPAAATGPSRGHEFSCEGELRLWADNTASGTWSVTINGTNTTGTFEGSFSETVAFPAPYQWEVRIDDLSTEYFDYIASGRGCETPVKGTTTTTTEVAVSDPPVPPTTVAPTPEPAPATVAPTPEPAPTTVAPTTVAEQPLACSVDCVAPAAAVAPTSTVAALATELPSTGVKLNLAVAAFLILALGLGTVRLARR